MITRRLLFTMIKVHDHINLRHGLFVWFSYEKYWNVNGSLVSLSCKTLLPKSFHVIHKVINQSAESYVCTLDQCAHLIGIPLVPL
jgi:hypothetical protein